MEPERFSEGHREQPERYRVLYMCVWPGDDEPLGRVEWNWRPFTTQNKIIRAREEQGGPDQNQQRSDVRQKNIQGLAQCRVEPKELPREIAEQDAKDKERIYGSAESRRHIQTIGSVTLR